MAQRSYGAYLAAASDARAHLLEDVRSRYVALLERARSGQYEPQFELARILHEPTSLNDLGLDPVEIVVACPSEWIESLLQARSFSADELIAVITRQSDLGVNPSVAVNVLTRMGRETGDVISLQWLSEHSSEPTRTDAFSALGNILLLQAQQVSGAQIDDLGAWVRTHQRGGGIQAA